MWTQSLRLTSCALSPGVGIRTGLSVADLRQSFLDNLFCSLGRVPMAATPNDIYTALALTVRDRVHKQGVRTMEARAEQEARVVAYLSAEFLPGHTWPTTSSISGSSKRRGRRSPSLDSISTR